MEAQTQFLIYLLFYLLLNHSFKINVKLFVSCIVHLFSWEELGFESLTILCRWGLQVTIHYFQ